MSLVRYTHKQLSDHAKRRPPGYLERLRLAIVREDAQGCTFDTQHLAWRQLTAEYRHRVTEDDDLTGGYDCGCGR